MTSQDRPTRALSAWYVTMVLCALSAWWRRNGIVRTDTDNAYLGLYRDVIRHNAYINLKAHRCQGSYNVRKSGTSQGNPPPVSKSMLVIRTSLWSRFIQLWYLLSWTMTYTDCSLLSGRFFSECMQMQVFVEPYLTGRDRWIGKQWREYMRHVRCIPSYYGNISEIFPTKEYLQEKQLLIYL